MSKTLGVFFPKVDWTLCVECLLKEYNLTPEGLLEKYGPSKYRLITEASLPGFVKLFGRMRCDACDKYIEGETE